MSRTAWFQWTHPYHPHPPPPDFSGIIKIQDKASVHCLESWDYQSQRFSPMMELDREVCLYVRNPSSNNRLTVHWPDDLQPKQMVAVAELPLRHGLALNQPGSRIPPSNILTLGFVAGSYFQYLSYTDAIDVWCDMMIEAAVCIARLYCH